MEESKQGNPFVYVELNTTNYAKAREFYGRLFGWQFTERHLGLSEEYSTFQPAHGPEGGIFSLDAGARGWLPYIGVRDIREATEKARSLGATIHVDRQNVPGVGWATILSDPMGAKVAIFQSQENQEKA